jgi:acyl carrier protein
MNAYDEDIKSCFFKALEQSDCQLEGKFSDDLILLESGLDSLGFALLVTLLEDKLGFDPFLEMDNPVYPVTYKEFVDIYNNHEAE